MGQASSRLTDCTEEKIKNIDLHIFRRVTIAIRNSYLIVTCQLSIPRRTGAENCDDLD